MTTETASRTQSLKQAAANIPAAFRLVWDAHHVATHHDGAADAGRRVDPGRASLGGQVDHRFGGGVDQRAR